MWWNGYWPMPWAFGPLFMLLIVVLCGAMMLFMMRGMMGRHRSSHDGALAILNERLARGEITEAEYVERRDLMDR